MSYKITAKNDGNLTITDITVTDERTGLSETIASLAPGESKEFTTETTVTEEDILSGHIINDATATGTSPDPDKPDVPVDPGHTDDDPEDKKGHLTIDKVTTSKPANGEAYALDETITYKITVKNDGNLTITDITVNDELTGDKWTIESLAPGESKEFTAKYKVTEADCKAEKVVNEATAEGKSPDPDKPDVPVTPGTDTEKAKGPHLTVIKTIGNTPANGSSFAKGEVIFYIIQVINDGGSTITGIKVKDALTGDNWTIESLKPGQTRTFTATYKVGEGDVRLGQVTNTAVPSSDMPNIPMTTGSVTTRTGEYTVPLGIGAAAAQCGDCFE